MQPGDRSGFGRYGYIDGDDEQVMCHECGKMCASVAAHANLAHGMSANEYRQAHGLPQRVALVAPKMSRRMSKSAKSRVGSEGWERMVAKRDPTAASRSRAPESFQRRGADVQAQIDHAKKYIKGVSKPITRRCRACGGLIHGRKGNHTCSPLCQRISTYEGKKRAPVEKWASLHDAGESWSAIGRQYGVSHTAVRVAVKTYRRYLADREYLAEHGPGEVPENRENA